MANKITKPAQPIQTDILCVGAGVASLSTALALLRKLKAAKCEKLPRVMVIDKGRNVGSHVLSGAVIDMSGFKGLLTEDEIKKIPVEARVNGKKESFHMLFGEKCSMKIPWMPPMMQAHGYPVGSLTKLTQYLAGLCEKEGAKVFTGFAAVELLEDEQGRVIGARTGEKGLDHQGKPKSNYLPSEKIYAKTVVLGEGACGILTEKLIKRKGLEGDREQAYALGIKEVVEVPADEKRVGEIAHTFGYPSDTTTYGGGFVYHVSATQVMICYAYALDYTKSAADPHTLFRKFKSHPTVAEHISGGKSVAYGAKVIPEGGCYSVPKVVADGALIVGDGAGLVDTLRIKGIHLAAMSGRAAAETLAECWTKNDFSLKALTPYTERLKKTEGWKQLWRVRNVRAPFSSHLTLGVMCAGSAWATFGAFPFWQVPMEADYKALEALPGGKMPVPETLESTPTSPDRLTDVFMSGTIHDEDQPCHAKILDRKKCDECITRFGAPCQRFCPAEVYRLEEGYIHVDFSNCLHCKTCQIKDPYQNIEWTFPQGGDGPRYTRM
ncbi:MAG: electron transfer flavoprotein-ubiquinone oxidoreductase, partial [Acidobacteriota bacterium]|jgi:electron-transferring-flavoprotein dehydrogenase|nr:electron transfer flavoprotein-ubiquinone oxidoreductase [Acidobacteriota bacterium]